MYPLAFAFLFLSHPVGLLMLLTCLGLIGMAINAAAPMQTFGAFTPQTAQQIFALAGSLYQTFAAGVVAQTIPAGVITGALTIYLNSAATTPGNQTTRTAVQLYADLLAAFGLPALPAGFTYELIITQTGAGTMTLVGGTGVTITGTATIAQNTTRTFVVQVTSPSAITITSVGTGTYS